MPVAIAVCGHGFGAVAAADGLSSDVEAARGSKAPDPRSRDAGLADATRLFAVSPGAFRAPLVDTVAR